MDNERGILQRELADKGCRRVRYINWPPGSKAWTSHFQHHNDMTWIVRHKQKAYAERCGFKNSDEIKKRVGPRWFWKLHEKS
jgi:hypothetical protein